MKLLLVLAVVAFCQANENDFKEITAEQVTCDDTHVAFAGMQENFPRYAGGDMAFGGCTLNDQFSIVAAFMDCNLKKTIAGDMVTFSTVIASPAPSGTIWRKRIIEVAVTCTYDRRSAKTAASAIKPHLGEIVGSLGQDGNRIDLFLNLLDADNNVVASGNDLAVEVGDMISAEVGGKNLAALGLNAYATNCFATPVADASSALRWDLVKDGCKTDETYTVMSSGLGQKLEFESFTFTDDVNSHVYLHCDLVACAPDDGCGMCLNRKRRSLMMHKSKSSMSKRVSMLLY